MHTARGQHSVPMFTPLSLCPFIPTAHICPLDTPFIISAVCARLVIAWDDQAAQICMRSKNKSAVLHGCVLCVVCVALLLLHLNKGGSFSHSLSYVSFPVADSWYTHCVSIASLCACLRVWMCGCVDLWFWDSVHVFVSSVPPLSLHFCVCLQKGCFITATFTYTDHFLTLLTFFLRSVRREAHVYSKVSFFLSLFLSFIQLIALTFSYATHSALLCLPLIISLMWCIFYLL